MLMFSLSEVQMSTSSLGVSDQQKLSKSYMILGEIGFLLVIKVISDVECR